MTTPITRFRRTRYSDNGYVFEAAAPALFRRGVRVYLVGNRDDLWLINTEIEAYGAAVTSGQLTVEALLRNLAQLKRRVANMSLTHTSTHSLVPFRTTHRVEVWFAR